jgi:hypothetical protein
VACPCDPRGATRGVKDWDRAAASRVQRDPLPLGRYLPMTTPWDEPVAQRWGPALTEPEADDDGPDPYVVAERQAIQTGGIPAGQTVASPRVRPSF